MDNSELAEQLNNELKTLKTYDEFNIFKEKVYDNCLDFYGKRRGYAASAFSNYIRIGLKYYESNDKVWYIYEDGTSTGSCRVYNLYKYLLIR
jgi:hypothetical protein